MKPNVMPVLGAVCVLLAAIAHSPAQGCDDPVWQIARTQWYPEMYYFYHLYQDGVPDNEKTTKRLTDFESKELAEVNVAIIPLNLSKRIIDSVDRITLTELNVRPFPYFALADKDGKRIAAAADAESLTKELAELTKTAERRKEPAPAPAKVLGLFKGKLPATGTAAEAEKAKVAAAFDKLPLELIDVDAPTPEQAKAVESLGVVNLPLLLMVDPSRRAMVKLPVDTPVEQLRPLFFSPRRTELVTKVLASMVTFAIVVGSDEKQAKEARELVKKATEESKKYFKDAKIDVIEIDAKDAAEVTLLKNLGAEPNTTKSSVVPVFGLGKAMGRLEVPAKSDTLVEAVAAVNGPCACTIRPEDFGYDLLLKLPQPEQPAPAREGKEPGPTPEGEE